MERKKVLVVGATGMAGHVVYLYLKETGHYEIFNTVYRNKLTRDSIVCDVRNRERLRAAINKTKPDILINCVGALIRESEKYPENAIYLNSYLPHVLKKACDELGGKLIHISTDCVFSGKKGNYEENDFRDADDIYGRSKALGEIFDGKHITLRTSLIGPELKEKGTSLFHWFMNQKGAIYGYNKAIWSGITTIELAKAINNVIRHDLHGLLHVTNGNPISKYELLKMINDKFKTTVERILLCENILTNKSLRPSLRFNFKIPSYRQMILEMETWINSHRSIYPIYVNSI